MNDKVKELSDDNLIQILETGKDDQLGTREVNQACLDELIRRYRRKGKPWIRMSNGYWKAQDTGEDVRANLIPLDIKAIIFPGAVQFRNEEIAIKVIESYREHD